jgi:F-type H+-transporting ATPase subunit epsilon
MKSFELEIINPERVVFKGTASSLVVPAFEGKLGVLAGHAPMVAQLLPGEVKVELDAPAEGETALFFAVSGGYAEIMQKRTRLFVETAEIADEINAERARIAMERAKNQVKQGAEIQKMQTAMQRALVRLRVAEKSKQRGRVKRRFTGNA